MLDTLRTELHDSARMHKATPHDRNLPSMGESEIAGSEANQPHLKFVVNYREGAKPKQKVFKKEEERSSSLGLKILIFGVIPFRT